MVSAPGPPRCGYGRASRPASPGAVRHRMLRLRLCRARRGHRHPAGERHRVRAPHPASARASAHRPRHATAMSRPVPPAAPPRAPVSCRLQSRSAPWPSRSRPVMPRPSRRPSPDTGTATGRARATGTVCRKGTRSGNGNGKGNGDGNGKGNGGNGNAAAGAFGVRAPCLHKPALMRQNEAGARHRAPRGGIMARAGTAVSTRRSEHNVLGIYLNDHLAGATAAPNWPAGSPDRTRMAGKAACCSDSRRRWRRIAPPC